MHPSSPQASLAKEGVIEARLGSWMFDTASQALWTKTACVVARQECDLGRDLPHLIEPHPTTNRGSGLSRSLVSNRALKRQRQKDSTYS
jgi:hypothetical protein